MLVAHLGAVKSFEVRTQLFSDAQINGDQTDDSCFTHTALRVLKTLTYDKHQRYLAPTKIVRP